MKLALAFALALFALPALAHDPGPAAQPGEEAVHIWVWKDWCPGGTTFLRDGADTKWQLEAGCTTVSTALFEEPLTIECAVRGVSVRFGRLRSYDLGCDGPVPAEPDCKPVPEPGGPVLLAAGVAFLATRRPPSTSRAPPGSNTPVRSRADPGKPE